MILGLLRLIPIIWLPIAYYGLGIRTEAGDTYAWAALGLPVIALLVIVEFVLWRIRSRRTLAKIAKRLGLRYRPGLFSARIDGEIDDPSGPLKVVLRTEKRNETGKGTCIEVHLGAPTTLAVGPERIRRRLQRAVDGAAELSMFHPDYEGVAIFAAEEPWRRFMGQKQMGKVMARFVHDRAGAVLNERVVACDMTSATNDAALSGFIDDAVEIAKRIKRELLSAAPTVRAAETPDDEPPTITG